MSKLVAGDGGSFECYVIYKLSKCAVLKITFCSHLDQHTFGSEASCQCLFNSLGSAGRQKAKISPYTAKHSAQPCLHSLFD